MIDVKSLKVGQELGLTDERFEGLRYKITSLYVAEDEDSDGNVPFEIGLKCLTSRETYSVTHEDETTKLLTVEVKGERFRSDGEVEFDYVKSTLAMADKRFSTFEIKKHDKSDTGNLRRWLFRCADSWDCWFDLVTWDNNIVIGGDISEMWIRKNTSEGDTLEWASRGLDDIHYLRNKVPISSLRKDWNEDVAKAWVNTEFARRVGTELFDYEGNAGTRESNLDALVDTRDSLLETLDDKDRHSFLHELYHETTWTEDGDMPDCTVPGHSFLWAVSALRKALSLIGVASNQEVTK